MSTTKAYVEYMRLARLVVRTLKDQPRKLQAPAPAGPAAGGVAGVDPLTAVPKGMYLRFLGTVLRARTRSALK